MYHFFFECGVFTTESLEGMSEVNRRCRRKLNKDITRDLRVQIAAGKLQHPWCGDPVLILVFYFSPEKSAKPILITVSG